MYVGIVEKHEDIRILTIEDEDLIREYVCDYLEDMGFLTLQASNGREGVEKIRTEKPDLVLTDLRMPEMNGLDVLSIMQNEFSSIPVIVISGTGSLSDVIQSLKFGAWDYILKPIHDYSILELSVNRVLERKRLIDENARYREHLEEEVVKRTLELEKSIQKFKMLFNLAGDAIFIHEPDGKIIDMNEQAVLYLGFTREQLSNMKMEELFTKSDAIDFKHEMEKLLDKQKIMYETVHKNSRGEFVPVEVNACLITMEQSPVILSVCRDISERKKAEEEKKKLEKQIVTAQKMECMGMLASGIAHDFNNILSGLNGYTVLLRSKMQPGSSESEYIKNIDNIIKMGQDITQRITTFVRKEREDLVSVDIHKVLSDTEALLRPGCKGINIVLEFNADKTIVLGDYSQLQNMFLNLGINSRDAMPQGGTISLSTFNETIVKESNQIQIIAIDISDTGTGMTKDTLSKLFDPLFTTKEHGKGTGLGLSSVLYCVKNLHGEINVESEPNHGTSFQIKLPLLSDTNIDCGS